MSVGPPGAVAQTAPAAAATKPLRIKTLTLRDFRAFPGPAPQAIEFGGKNLLVHGENGAGKSSIFHALRAVFSDGPQARRGSLAEYKNKFSASGVGCARIDVAFDGLAETASWTLGLMSSSAHPAGDGSPILAEAAVERHPFTLMPEPGRTAFRRASARAACLDYRALLDTNYRHGDEEINLFGVCVSHLLRDYDYTPPGGKPTTLGALWAAVDGADKTVAVGYMDGRHSPRLVANCKLLNDALTEVLPKLQPVINSLLKEMGHGELEIANLVYAPVGLKAAWNLDQRGLTGGTIRPTVSYRNHQPNRAQHFLNEARLSALALAIYFAGRLVCTPAGDDAALKLLVLDDVLIGLDHANRLPVLDLLVNRFASWQVVLLTHDRGWFEMARGRLDASAWCCVEIFEGDRAARAPMPIVRTTTNRPAKQYLAQAKHLLAERYVEASANYARQAFEAALRGGCQHHHLRVVFKQNTKEVKAEDLLTAVEEWAKKDNARRQRFEPVLARLRLLRDVVMNPYSHPLAPNIPTAEVQDAINALDKLLDAFDGKP